MTPPYSIKDLFNAVDTDGNGLIDRSELIALMQEQKMDVSFGQLRQLMEATDSNGDGTMNLAEFTQLMQGLK